MNHADDQKRKFQTVGKNMYKGPEEGMCFQVTAGWLEYSDLESSMNFK